MNTETVKGLEMDYLKFVESKRKAAGAEGFPRDDVDGMDWPACLFEWQRKVVRWALIRGRACLFEDCGLGKTLQQIVWARMVATLADGPVIILAPLAVADQTAAEAAKFGIHGVSVSRDGAVLTDIVVTNYEKMHLFDMAEFVGIVLDESSILKSVDGSTRTRLLEIAQDIPYRLACTATPSPNDITELCNHAEFVGASTRAEMLATWFVHDGGSTQDWRLKGHAVDAFWKWVASWAVMMRTPADIGEDGAGYVLPPLAMVEHIIESGATTEGELFARPALSLTDQRNARKATLEGRVAHVARMVNTTPGQWVVWCELNAEGDALAKAIDGAVQVAGSTPDDVKSATMLGFAAGSVRVIVTKPSIAGFGMNWQKCHQMAFVGLSHSWEQFYQAVRRCWRFGQINPVDVHIVSSDVEVVVLQNIKAKQAAADDMAAEMVKHMDAAMKAELNTTTYAKADYATDVAAGAGWTMHLGDCVEVVAKIQSDSVGYSIFSPPFASLYTYSASDRDMGNCAGEDEFMAHFAYLLKDLHRVMMPGRLVSIHCMDLPTSKSRHGYIGLVDFRGHIVKAMQDAGFIYHSIVTIWKDPVQAMQRTKALGLLHKTIRSDSAMSRQGMPDYLVTFRKPGDNPEPVAHPDNVFPVDMWQRYASPVWTDINPSDTLQYRSAREHADERHICPLQLGVIRRGLALWTNPGDLVLSPFGGIGSEGYCALEMGRRFVGAELKRSYWAQAVANLTSVSDDPQLDMFGKMASRTDSAEAHMIAALSCVDLAIPGPK